MPKQGRNEQCNCGSGKKYKNCCINAISNGVLKELQNATFRGLEYEESQRVASLATVQEIANRPSLTNDELVSAKISLAQAHQRLGEHLKAIQVLDSIALESDSPIAQEAILFLKGISLGDLGDVEYAAATFDQLRTRWEGAREPQGERRRTRGFHLLEMGKAYRRIRNNSAARKSWELAASYLKSFGEVEHVHRAVSNLAFLDLWDEDEAVQDRGAKMLEKLISEKLKIGDLAGAATNYCNLGTYYFHNKRVERAIAYYRRDLSISRYVGDKRQLATSLGNLGAMYGELKQLKAAREHLREAEVLGRELEDPGLLNITRQQLARIEEIGRKSGQEKTAIGPNAPCMCESGKTYVGCCGRADFEPVDLPYLYGGVSEDVGRLREEISAHGRQPSHLDFVLRSTSEASRRQGWCEMRREDGWFSVREMPDMANIHLISAKAMAARAIDASDMENPLAAVLLSVCHLEAFVNQLSYFLHEYRTDTHAIPGGVPKELLEGEPLQYQRSTALEDKWLALTKSLLGFNWLEQQPVWREVKNLIYIRNELVHFKTAGYEQVVPPPAKLETIYSKVPAEAPPREVPHSWPMRVITRELAAWSVRISEELVNQLKAEYERARREAAAGAS